MASEFQKTYRFELDEFLDTFGMEFCKHEVLWKPQPNCKQFRIQSAVAYRKLAQTLNLSLEVVLELLEAFPAACLDRISRTERHRIVGVGCRMPDWLTLLAGHFRLVNKSLKVLLEVETQKYISSRASARHELMRALCESAWVGFGAAPARGLTKGSAGVTAVGSVAVTEDVTASGSVEVPAAETEDEASRLRGPLAVAYFAARHGVSQEEVLPAWRSALELSVLKLRALLAAGDRVRMLPLALRPTAAERALADLALLHDRNLSQISILTPAKLRMLGLLFQLIVAAKRNYDEGRGREGGGAARADAEDDPSPPAGAGRGERGEVRSDESAPTPEESSDEEPHPELDPELITLVLSSDTSDDEISDIYSGECSKNNIEVPVLFNKSRVERSGRDMMEKTNASKREGESYISSKSDTRSEYPTKYWYEESESNLSEKQRVVWALVYTDFLKRGRSASLISLQHRWVELLHLTRKALLTAWSSKSQDDRHVHPLLLVVAHWFPKIITDKLPSWERLVSDRQIVLESDIKDIIIKYQQNDNVLLNITENLCFPDLLQKYVNDDNVNEPHGPSESNNTDTLVSYQIHHENPTNIINNINKGLEQESQDNSTNNELNVNNNVITILDQIDPCQAKVSIIILEDEDEGDKDDSSTNITETKPDINNLNMSDNEQGATHLREENNHIQYTLEKCNKINKDKQTANGGVRSQDGASSSKPCRTVVDKKLVNLPRVVITPIEHLPVWNKHSKNGVIRCRSFSVRNFMKPVMVTAKQLSKCSPYINTNKNYSQERETEEYRKNEVRIKFEDDSFDSDFGFGDDINNGIKYKKYIELYTMPTHLRKNRIKLTRKLKLSRTYFSLNFWSLDSNVELLKLCKPMAIKLNRSIPRVAKRVELSDINEVRRINRSILTAQVSPTVDTAEPHTQRSCASQETVNFTNNSISLDSGTPRKTNDSLSSVVDSTELLNLLTNYAIKTKLPKESVIESVTKDITANTNLMDSIIDAMRLSDNGNIQKTFLQQSPVPSSDPSDSCDTNIPPTNTFHTIQTSTEEVRNDLNFNSINNSLLDTATASKSHISSDHTKDLDTIDPQKINNNYNTLFKPAKAKIPNVGELKNMILLMVKHFDSTMKYDNMKINRSSLNLHLKNFEKEQRDLIKNITKLNETIPQYVFNITQKKKVSKNATATEKQKKINRIKLKQSKELSTLPSGHIENITDVATNTNSHIFDDDCEHNLVIDERRLELSDNMDFNNSQCNKINTNKNIQETCNIRKNDKKEKNIKRARKRFKQTKKISEKEKPILNEYQEWYRQKTMALKYFILPTSDGSKLISKDKTAKQKSTTSTEQQSNGCQTNITINSKITEDLASTSTVWQNIGCQTNIIKTTTLTEKQSNVCQTTITINSKNTEDLARTATEQQSSDCQTNITVKRKNTEDLASTATEQQSSGCQTNITVKRKNTEDLASTATEQQSSGCQTNITVKRKNTEDISRTVTASDMTKRLKFSNVQKPSNENNVVYISDSSSDSEVQITECFIAKDTNKNNPNNPNTANTTQPDIHDTDKIGNGNKKIFFNDTPERQVACPNVCVINTPVAVNTQPVYFIINDSQMPAAPDAIYKTQDSETMTNPIFFQVLPNGISFPTLTQEVQQNKNLQTQIVVTNEKCNLTNKCKCIKCGNPLRDDILTSTPDVIQNVTPLDSENNEPSTSLPTQSEHLIEEGITVKQYLEETNKKPTALIKVHSQKLLFFCSKYIILTDVNIPSDDATYRTTIKIKNKKKLCKVLVPSDIKGSVLLLGPKEKSDYLHCECPMEQRVQCDLCQRINSILPNPTTLIKIGKSYYKNINDQPKKYVRLTDKELATNKPSALEGNPHLILINKMFFKKLTDSPSTYVRILSAPPDAATLRHLVRKEVVLYAFNVTHTQHNYVPLKYTHTDGQFAIEHTDDKLVDVLQWILN